MKDWFERVIHRWWWPSLWYQIDHYRRDSDENYGAARNYNHELGLVEKELEKLQTNEF